MSVHINANSTVNIYIFLSINLSVAYICIRMEIYMYTVFKKGEKGKGSGGGTAAVEFRQQVLKFYTVFTRVWVRFVTLSNTSMNELEILYFIKNMFQNQRSRRSSPANSEDDKYEEELITTCVANILLSR